MSKTRIFKSDHKQVQHWLGYTSDTYLNFLIDQLQPAENELILDNGCGNGRFSIALGQEGARVVALDLNFSLVKKTAVRADEEKLNRKIEYVLADMQNLPFKAGVFDKILCAHNLWYIPNYRMAAKEMLRTLKKNGVIVLDHLNILSPRIFLAWIQYFASKIARRSPTPVFYRNPYAILGPFAAFKTSVFSLKTGHEGRLYAIKGFDPFSPRFMVKCLK